MTTLTHCQLENLADWYVHQQLSFDKKLILLNLETLRTMFRGTSCLEMGPADGTMTASLVELFQHVDVVDGSQMLLDQIPPADNLRKFCQLFETFAPDRAYDTVLMSHILEHIEQPIDVLRRVHRWLHAESVLIVSVPNAKSFHRLAGVKMGMLESEYSLHERDHALGHQRVYDLDLLCEHVEQAGFRIEKTGGVFFKPIAQAQIDELWDDAMIRAYYELGKQFPDHGAEIYVTATL